MQKADFANESGSNCRADVWSSWEASSAFLGRVGQGGYPDSMAGLGPWLVQVCLSPALEENSFIFLSPNMMNTPG